jgi:hypothetical protein
MIRQIWLLLVNCYNLILQPEITLKKINQDKSQKLLLGIIIFMPLISYFGARILWDNYQYGSLINSVGKVFFLILFIQIFIFSYLIYWLVRMIFLKRTTKNV